MFGKKPTLADQLVEVLVQAGVTRIFGLVGDSLNPVSDAVRRSGGAAKVIRVPPDSTDWSRSLVTASRVS